MTLICRCSLGDVTNNDTCYEKALEVSDDKSARAKVIFISQTKCDSHYLIPISCYNCIFMCISGLLLVVHIIEGTTRHLNSFGMFSLMGLILFYSEV